MNRKIKNAIDKANNLFKVEHLSELSFDVHAGSISFNASGLSLLLIRINKNAINNIKTISETITTLNRFQLIERDRLAVIVYSNKLYNYDVDKIRVYVPIKKEEEPKIENEEKEEKKVKKQPKLIEEVKEGEGSKKWFQK